VAKKYPGTPAVTIVSVAPGSAGAEPYRNPRGGVSRLEPGDAIFRVNNQDINSVEQFDRIINRIPPGETVYIRLRDGQNGAWFDWQGKMPDTDR
jgi:S1-C subfamily serine protease